MNWKQIEDFHYEVSETGEVRNIKFNRPVKPYNNGNGYYHVDLQKKGKSYPRSLHRVLMKAFRPGGEKEHVNHIDGNPANNRLDNLEWATASENHKHRYHVLGKGARQSKTTGRWELPNDC